MVLISKPASDNHACSVDPVSANGRPEAKPSSIAAQIRRLLKTARYLENIGVLLCVDLFLKAMKQYLAYIE
ncbi:hypothetical protein [Deefgea sp. CFH1-16]|uniref:hypothetical protein n=1 Tax=Deefgea sp. CFH1-16 TaxID=2675457 RepID=UPI001FFD72AE|nr:hypothetical protein [Deefgea sp. CFH1-16]